MNAFEFWAELNRQYYEKFPEDREHRTAERLINAERFAIGGSRATEKLAACFRAAAPAYGSATPPAVSRNPFDFTTPAVDDEGHPLPETGAEDDGILVLPSDELVTRCCSDAAGAIDRLTIARIPWYVKLWCRIIRRPLV